MRITTACFFPVFLFLLLWQRVFPLLVKELAEVCFRYFKIALGLGLVPIDTVFNEAGIVVDRLIVCSTRLLEELNHRFFCLDP